MLKQLLELGAFPPAAAAAVSMTGTDPVVPTPFRVGEAAASVLAAQAAAIGAIWEMRGGERQTAAIDIAAAAVSLKSVLYLRREGFVVPYPDPIYPLTNFHKCADGRSIFLHAGYPHLRNGLLDLLDCPNNLAAIDAAVGRWSSLALEDAVAAAGLCGGIARTPAEWLAHPQGQWLTGQPVVAIEPIGNAPAEPFGPGPRPLAGIRALDLTHVLAGPTSARTLAEQGATVLRVRAPANPTIPSFVIDTGHGKLSTVLDLTVPADADQLRRLIGEADMFVQSFRPGAMAALGFSPSEVAAIRPGIIYVSICCYGDGGPWGTRRGWEQLAQSVTGMAIGQGSADEPKVSPVYPNDYVTGYLAAYGATLALLQRASVGGSYHVRVSLARTAMWIQSFGMVENWQDAAVPPGLITRLTETRETPYGFLSYLGPITQFSDTKAYWALPTPPLAAHPPTWPALPTSIANRQVAAEPEIL